MKRWLVILGFLAVALQGPLPVELHAVESDCCCTQEQSCDLESSCGCQECRVMTAPTFLFARIWQLLPVFSPGFRFIDLSSPIDNLDHRPPSPPPRVHA